MVTIPNFFIIGTVRGGTTWLHRQLSAHPQVFMCEPKEPHYYSGVSQRCGSRHVPHILTTDGYRHLFQQAGDHLAIGDASTSYLWSDRAAERIHRDVPSAQIIAVLRDPVDRAFSHYLKDVREGVQRRPFYEALLEDSKIKVRSWEHCRLYVDLGYYCQSLKRYLDVFGSERVMILSFNQIRRSPEDIGARIAAFLGIDAALLPPPRGAENAYARPANGAARRLLGNQTLRLAVRVLPYPLRRAIKERLLLRRDEKPALDRRSIEFLAPLFADDLERLQRLLGRPMPELSVHLRGVTDPVNEGGRVAHVG